MRSAVPKWELPSLLFLVITRFQDRWCHSPDKWLLTPRTSGRGIHSRVQRRGPERTSGTLDFSAPRRSILGCSPLLCTLAQDVSTPLRASYCNCSNRAPSTHWSKRLRGPSKPAPAEQSRRRAIIEPRENENTALASASALSRRK